MNKFIACDKEYKDSDIVIIGVPYDGSASNRKGTKEGPLNIRRDSDAIESYSVYQDKDIEDINVCDLGNLNVPNHDTQKMLEIVYDKTKEILNDNKIPFILGGEHSISYGPVKALHEVYPDMVVIHFDAHTDLRDGYLDDHFSHASVIRRIHDVLGDNKIFSFGIRSGLKEEFIFAEKHNYIEKFTLNTLDEIINKIQDKPVYITIDLDVLDPSVFPGTGTQEPGGISYHDLLNAILKFNKLNNIIGADIVELSPVLDPSGTSTAVAAKTVRELLLTIKRA